MSVKSQNEEGLTIKEAIARANELLSLITGGAVDDAHHNAMRLFFPLMEESPVPTNLGVDNYEVLLTSAIMIIAEQRDQLNNLRKESI